MYDLIVKDAVVVDGLGTAPRSADVAVAGDRIAAIGAIAEPARQTVDAAGLTLAPGIIDLHTHYDAQLTWDPTASPSPALGVTTVVVGNCGFGIAPCPPEQRELVAANLSVVEGMSLEALRAGVDWGFETFPEYLAFLRQKRTVPNVAAFVGHSPVRTAVMGPEGSERAATGDEVATMKRIVRDALDAGAIGFASSVGINHIGHGGVPMPSRLADENELATLVGVLGDVGHGVFHIGAGDGERLSVEDLERLARASGRPVVFSPGIPQPRVSRARRIAARGVRSGAWPRDRDIRPGVVSAVEPRLHARQRLPDVQPGGVVGAAVGGPCDAEHGVPRSGVPRPLPRRLQQAR